MIFEAKWDIRGFPPSAVIQLPTQTKFLTVPELSLPKANADTGLCQYWRNTTLWGCKANTVPDTAIARQFNTFCEAWMLSLGKVIPSAVSKSTSLFSEAQSATSCLTFWKTSSMVELRRNKGPRHHVCTPGAIAKDTGSSPHALTFLEVCS